ncbi:restriction endonuclease subunit S [Bifidobacterium adolescentis]|uniref:restriction endonuclease subunit S n=1 Tax=Bifidobacterium adolescentis TaxID=1680 RepID=UPI003D7B1B3E
MAEQHGKTLVPQIRFAGFTDPWEQRKLGDILQERNVRTSDFESNPIFSLTIEDGITPKTDRYERTSLITKTEDLFKIVSPNEFVTNPMNLRFGAFGYNKNSLSVCVSGYYDVFSIDNDKCSGFWNSYFKTPVALKRFDDAATGSLIEKRRVKYSTLCQLIFLMPKGMGEKKQIGAFFDRLDSLITLHQRKYDKLCVLKKSMLDKMFPKGGSLYPEIRFAGFTDPWEQRKLGDVATIVGGGTPSTNNDAYWDGDIDWYSPAELGEQVYADRSARRITQAGYDSCSATLLPAGKTILFTSRAGIGNTAILRRSACTNQGFQSLVVNDDTDVYFVYSMTDRIKNFAEQKASGSTFLEISGKGLAAGEFAFPSKDEQTAIGSMFKQLDHLITLHQRKLELLRNIKKSMLDKMFV